MSSTVQPAEAKNGSKYYGKLSDALSSSSEGTIEVLSSANATGTLKDNVTLKDLVGNTFTAAEGDAEVTVKSGVLTGLNSGKGDYSGSGSVTVDGKAVGTKSAPEGEDGTGTVGQAKVAEGDTAKVGENSCKGTDNTKLDIVKDGPNEGHVELAEGSVTLPAGSDGKNNSVTVNGKVVENTGNSDITVEKDANRKIKVTVPGSTGGKVVVDGREYEIPKGPTVLTVDPTGEANVYTLESGDVNVDPKDDVHVKVGEEDVTVENLGEGDGKELTVEAGTPEKGATVTVPAGGKMQAGDDVYSNGGEDPVQVELRPEGNHVINGDVTLEDGEIVIPGGMPKGTVTGGDGEKKTTIENSGSGDITVTADQPTEGKTMVVVPEGGKAKIGE